MAEKKVGKTDDRAITFKAEGADKITVAGGCFEGEKVTVLKGQVFEARREDGSVVFVVKDKDAPAAAFTREDLRRALVKVDELGEGPWDAVDLLTPLAVALGLAP